MIFSILCVLIVAVGIVVMSHDARRLVTDLFWYAVFKAKHRAGFLDLGLDAVVTGTVWKNDGGSEDGDTCFSIVPDDASWCLFAKRYTSEDVAKQPVSLHCEVPPWANSRLKLVALTLPVGARVKVKGRWGYDGVHSGHGVVTDVLWAILGHGPDTRNGWCELHPVTDIELAPPSEAK